MDRSPRSTVLLSRYDVAVLSVCKFDVPPPPFLLYPVFLRRPRNCSTRYGRVTAKVTQIGVAADLVILSTTTDCSRFDLFATWGTGGQLPTWGWRHLFSAGDEHAKINDCRFPSY